MKDRSRTSCIVAAVLGAGFATAGTAALPPLTVTPITFCPQGAAGDCIENVGAFDWTPNTAVFKDVISAGAGSPNTPVQTYLHTALQGYSDGDGNPGSISGLNIDFEVTAVAGWPASVTPNALGGVDFAGALDMTGSENFVRFYHDETKDSDSLSGDGYGDGNVILQGALLELEGNFNPDGGTALLDGFFTDNWGIRSITGDGAEQVHILVTEVDEDYFPNLPVGSIIPFSTQLVLNFLEVNPSRTMDTEDGSTTPSQPGDFNWVTGPDGMNQIDPNNAFTPAPSEALGCRVTGGGNDEFGNYVDEAGIPNDGSAGWSGSTGSGAFAVTETVVKVNGKSGNVRVTEETSYNVYTFGGQAGANTALQPQPKGELEHVNHSGPAGQFSFHLGTASAPPGTEVDIIQCSDPGWCRQARPAPAKQIDIAGIGTFRNIIDEGNLNDSGDCASVTQLKGKPSERSIGTYNWAEYHIEDHGEPGREGQHTTADPAQCPAEGTGTDAFSAYNGTGSRVDAVLNGTYNEFTCKTDNDPSTECPDFYRIRIYCGVEPTFDENGDLSNFDEIAAQKANGPIYEVYGYIDGGNWQIHPLTGFDLKNF